MNYNGPGDSDVYCAAIARRKGLSVKCYRATLDKEHPRNDQAFVRDVKATKEHEFVKAMRDVFEEPSGFPPKL